MPTRTVELPEKLDRLIEAGIEAGRYADAGEVIREGLRLLEQRDREDTAKLEWLQEAAQEAACSLERGEGVRFDSVDEAAEYVRSAARRRAEPAQVTDRVAS